MNLVVPVERNREMRCTSTDVESVGRTHLCKQTVRHDDDHECICQRSWGEAVPA